MSHLSLSLLGGFEVTLDGEPIAAFGTDKARALLAFLAVEAARPHRRAELAGMLWSDLPEKKAAHNLSQTLLRLRRALREPDPPAQSFLLVTSQEVQFNPRSDYRLDVALFRELITAQRQHHSSPGETCPICIQWLQQAAALYRGDLLSGFFVRDCVGFEEWRLVLQEALHGQALDMLARLAVYYERRGEAEQVQHYARRQVALEPWREQAHLQLMRALAWRGQFGAALEQYQTYRRTLARELGLRPSAEATTLYEQIRAAGASKAKLPVSPFQSPPEASNPQPSISPGGERRQVTVLVCGRENQAGRSDLEELHEQLALCEGSCQGVCHRFGGYRWQRQGEACFIYFGYPQAYEDATRRAIHTAIAMADRFKNQPYPVRIGLHTGLMVVSRRGPGPQDHELVGEVPTIARGCQNLAEPGEVLITADTERLAWGWFDCRALGPRLLPATAGLADPLELYQVLGELNIPNRLDWLAQTQPLTSLVGRESELARLVACREQVEQGRGQVILLQGEPGIGKSRLVWELKRSTLGQTDSSPHARPILWLESRCSPYFQNTGLYPLVGWLEQLLGFAAGDSLEVKRDKLAGGLARFELDHPAAVWLLSLLLELPGADQAPQPITPEQREQMRQVFVALLQKRAAEQPVALVLEDLHWSDPSTLEWLGQSFDSLAAAPCLTLLTFRPTFTPSWLPRPHLLLLTLEPLTSAQAGLMVSHLAGEETLGDEIRRRIVKQTDGIPLFVEEMTLALLESGTQTFEVRFAKTSKVVDLPVTLRDSLLARLDHLGAAKETAQWAAALGRDFLYPVLQAVTPFDEQRLQTDLARLIEADLVYPQGQAPYASYTFKHSLIQETAYASLLKRTRQDHHRRIAETLAAHFPHMAETQPEVLAQHYAQAGSNVQAVDYWLRAGERATTQGATLEARTFFDQALELIEPADRERRWRALLGRETVFNLREEREAQKNDIEALLELADALNDDSRRAQAFLRQDQYAARIKDFPLMLRAAETAIAAAVRAGNRLLEVQALSSKAGTLAYTGEWLTAQQVAEEVLAKLPGIEDNVVQGRILGSLGFYYARAGDLSRALSLLSQGVGAARRAGNRQKEGRFVMNIGYVYISLGYYAQARATLEEGLALAEAIGDVALQTSLRYNLSYAYWRTGDRDRAQKVGEQALQEFRTTGSNLLGHACCLEYLGLYRAKTEDWSAAMTYLAEAQARYGRIGADLFRMEVQAVEARCLLALGRREEAQQLATEVWAFLRERSAEGIELLSLVYLYLANVFNGVETFESAGLAGEVIEAGYRELMRIAHKISDPQWRQSFLENVPENRSLVERWERLQQNELWNSSPRPELGGRSLDEMIGQGCSVLLS
ncbi:MAG: AAA family ATPase [Chloroflexota bacterium]